MGRPQAKGEAISTRTGRSLKWSKPLARSPVKIANAPPAGSSFTTSNRARRFVRSGRAKWCSPAKREIEFVSAPAPHAGAHGPNLYNLVLFDATPGRSVFGPWPGWDVRLFSAPGVDL